MGMSYPANKCDDLQEDVCGEGEALFTGRIHELLPVSKVTALAPVSQEGELSAAHTFCIFCIARFQLSSQVRTGVSLTPV